ncbi:hypothetical protein [Kitasatospora sp. NPDC091207]|uniref:hypothetical protein n=1 Tax=Kitasatospora sp. NPDC091207 TaxID=3364083 RepID=UPI00381D0406
MPSTAPTFAPASPATGGTAAPAPSSSWTPAPRPGPHPQAPHLATDATRYLCAAVQLESDLSNRAIESVLKETHRAIASSPGVDLVCVLRYALAARARQTTAQVLLALTAIALLASFAYQPLSDPSTSVVPLPLPPLGLPLLAVAWGIVLVERLITFYSVLRPKLRRDAFDPARAPSARPQDENLLSRLATEDQQGNVSVFSGYEPFLGYGRLLNSWNFTVAVDRPGESFDQVLPFTLKTLDTEVMAAVAALGLPGVEISERVFVSGADLAQGLDPALRPLLLPRPEGRPQIALGPAVLDRLRDDGSGRARPYLVTTVSGWNSELVASTTVRFSLSPARDLLFVEGAVSLLPPLHRRYHQVDHLLDRPTWWQLLALLRGSAAAVPFRLPTAPFKVLALVAGRLADSRKERDQRRQIALGAFNYGAALSLRETASDPQFHRYFQQVDSQMYSKIVERRVLDTLTDFLAAHQVDISELRERQNVIYNGGVFTSGNATVNFVNSSVAAGAASRIMNRAGRAPAGGRREG